MHTNKLSFLVFLSFLSFNLQSANSGKSYKATGYKLSCFDLEIEKKTNTQHFLSTRNVRIKLIPGEGFSGFGSDDIEGFAGVLIGSKKVFFKLPNQNPIPLAAFLSALHKNKGIPTENLSEIISLFFQGDTTPDILSSFTYEKAYEVTLRDGSQALVLVPEIEPVQ